MLVSEERDEEDTNTDIVAFIEPVQHDRYGWMDDRWNEDEYEGSDGLATLEGHGGMGRAAGERPNTPLNTDEI